MESKEPLKSKELCREIFGYLLSLESKGEPTLENMPIIDDELIASFKANPTAFYQELLNAIFSNALQSVREEIGQDTAEYEKQILPLLEFKEKGEFPLENILKSSASNLVVKHLLNQLPTTKQGIALLVKSIFYLYNLL